jgi:hypothetical protein
VARVYGVWFKRLDTDFCSIDRYGSKVGKTANNTWSCMIPFEYDLYQGWREEW